MLDELMGFVIHILLWDFFFYRYVGFIPPWYSLMSLRSHLTMTLDHNYVGQSNKK